MGSHQLVPVILCGGNGTRLWPRSRATKPKPFLPLIGTSTLFEQAVRRCPPEQGFSNPVIVTGAVHLNHVREQLGAAPAAIIVEPFARNTAAAIALAALRLPEDAVMIVCPSDHHIGNTAAFQHAVHHAASLAADGWLVSLGIRATAPETGYGYLKRGEAIGTLGFKVERFVEKPDLATARNYIADGDHAWNGGIFAFRIRDYLAELAAFRPDIASAAREAVAAGRAEGACFSPDPGAFSTIHGESVDYAVMEKTAHAAMVDVDMDWSDIGNWHALYASRPQDGEGNSVTGTADLVDCRNVMVDSDGPRLSVIGVEDVIIIVDGSEILVTSANGAQRVGKLPGAANQ